VAHTCRTLDVDNQPIGLTYWTDGGVLAAAGIETIILGPGDIALAHSPQESVPVLELTLAARIYTAAVSRLLT